MPEYPENSRRVLLQEYYSLMHIAEAVSYTHLDVYKRQAYTDHGKSDDEYFRFYSTDAKLDSRIFT